MIIWGYRRYLQQLAMVTFVCGGCGNPAAQALKRAVTKFTLFFIPLFPISSKYFTQCTFCGHTQRVAKDDAERLQAQPAQPYPATPQAANQAGYPGYPQNGPQGALPPHQAPGGYPQAPGGYPQQPQR